MTRPYPDDGPGDRARPDVVGLAAVLLACPLVEGLHGGPHDRIATPAGDGRLVGVRVEGTALVVGVVGRPGSTTDEIATRIRSLLAEHAPGYQVTVSVETAAHPG